MIEITMQNGGTIRIELDKTAAPITVENFEKLAGFFCMWKRMKEQIKNSGRSKMIVRCR